MDSTHKLKLGVLKEEIRGEDGNLSPHTDSLARCLSLGLLRCHAPLQLLLSSSPPVVISFPRHHVFPSFASPPFYSALVSPFTLVSSHFFYLFSMSVALMVISCCPPRLQCCVTSLEVWKDDLALCLHFFFPLLLSRTLLQLSLFHHHFFSHAWSSQSTCQSLPFFSFIHSHCTLSFPRLSISFSLPSLFSFIIKCCHNVPCCATLVIYS